MVRSQNDLAFQSLTFRVEERQTVATRHSSFVVYNESVQSGASYISDIESDEQFVASFLKAVGAPEKLASEVLPYWGRA